MHFGLSLHFMLAYFEYVLKLGKSFQFQGSDRPQDNDFFNDGLSENVEFCDKSNGSTKSFNNQFSSQFFFNVRNNHTASVTIARNKVYHSDASISLPSLGASDFRFYQEDISKKLFKFYVGKFFFIDLSVPFSAIETRQSIIGTAFLHGSKVTLYCSNISLQPIDFYYTDKNCFPCKVSISHPLQMSLSNASEAFAAGVKGFHKDRLTVFHPESGFPKNPQKITGPTKQKRSIPNEQAPTSCSLYLHADYLFYKFVGNGDSLNTVNLMLDLVNKLDSIFRSTDFDGDGWADNIGFLVKRIAVSNKNKADSTFTLKPSKNPDEYLKEFSFNDFSSYCLAIAFTFTDFLGTAGSSYFAYSDSSVAGGICQKPVNEGSNNISFNSLVVTYLLMGKRRTETDVLLTLAHEVGHSFGALHDDQTSCTGPQKHGAFIMSPATNTGYEANNHRFSKCSLRNMFPIIKRKGDCLIPDSLKPQCGNGLVEEGEECDCGWSEVCNEIDPCCTPADETSEVDKPCSIRRSRGKLCSPLVSPCCTETCKLIPKTSNFTCHNFDDCSQTSRCNGLSPHCPQTILPDGTACNGGLQVCSQGECSKGLCEANNLSACFCEEANQCEICCRQNNSCLPLRNMTSHNHTALLYNEGNIMCAGSYCSHSSQCFGFTMPPHMSFVSELKALAAVFKQNWEQYLSFVLVTILIVIILSVSSFKKNANNAKSLRYGKMLGIMILGHHTTKIYDEILQEIDAYYQEAIRRMEIQRMPRAYLDALCRLKALFPDASVEYLSKIAKISATEEVAVKILLIQGFKMRTFSSSPSGCSMKSIKSKL